MITPTVGRVVWYWPSRGEMARNEGAPCAAIITAVWTDTCVNLAVFDTNGMPHARSSQLLHQEGNPKPDCNFAEWMPYQKGQAAKTEELEKALTDKA